MMISADQVSMLSEAEVIGLRIETRAWSREIRRCMIELVNNRIAKRISHEEYMASRSAALDERAECDRRTALLNR
ncbi:MAG TPA: hypothetical protein VGK29_11770 [Paludibaculum sp.]|jgi:hypothetical protein